MTSLAIAASVEACNGLAVTRIYNVGVASETNDGVSIAGFTKIRSGLIVSIAESGVSAARFKHYILGLAWQPFGVASEVNSVNGIASITKTFVLGKAVEVNAGVEVDAQRKYVLGTVSETDTANAITAITKTFVLGKAVETNTGVEVDAQRKYVLGKASEVESANAITSITRFWGVNTTVASEAETAPAITSITKHKPVDLADETNTAKACTTKRVYVVSKATETSDAKAINSIAKNLQLGKANETNEALGVLIRHVRIVGIASQTDEALAIDYYKKIVAPVLIEVNTGKALSVTKLFTGLQAVEVDRALARIVPSRTAILNTKASDIDLIFETKVPN